MQDVDHEQRRRTIAEIAVEVIGSEGLEAATVRRIAARAGYSTTVITHYFKNKEELLLLAYRHIALQARQRLEAVTTADPTDILGALMTMTTAEPSVQKAWRVYIALWQKAGHVPVLARVQQEEITHILDQFSTVIRARIGDHPDSHRFARHLIALVQGTAIQSLFDADSWSPEELRQTLDREIEFLLAGR